MDDLESIINFLPVDAANKKVSDPTALNNIISVAQDWNGSDEKKVDQLQKVLESFTTMKSTAISKLCRDMKVKAVLQTSPDGYEEFVDAWTAKHEVDFTIDRQLTMAGKDISDIEILNKIILWTARYGAFTRREYVTAAWKNWKSEKYAVGFQAFKNRISYNPDSSDHWNTVIDALLRDDGSIPNYRELTTAIFRGAVWRVKNKLAGNSVRQHIMPYLRGRQGCGKTSFMRWFLSPVQDGVSSATFEMFDHDEKTYVLRDAPIVFFDEVAKSQRADLNMVKNMMTSDTTMFRKLYGEATKGKILSTFFGAGNLELEEVFNDPTGLRRFFQIEINQNLYQRLIDLQSLIDPLSLWQSVNESDPSPIESEAIVEMLKIIQREVRPATTIERWLNDVATDGGTNDFEEVSDLFRSFRRWCELSNVRDNTTLFSFQNLISRTLKDQPDGKFPYQHKKHAKTRRSLYQIGSLIVPIAHNDDETDIIQRLYGDVA